MSNTNEHAKNLRRTRADMLGTDDEAHYWECHAAAAYLLKLEVALRHISGFIPINPEYGYQGVDADAMQLLAKKALASGGET